MSNKTNFSCRECGSTKFMSAGYCNKHYIQVRKYGHVLTEEERLLHYRKKKGVCLNTGRTRFKQGFTPWNKGKKTGLQAWNSGLKNPWTKAHIEKLKQVHTGNTYSLGHKRPDITGDKNPNWKGGTKSKDSIERVKFRKHYQKLVLQRDDYTCQMCDQYSGNLQVDHIKSWAEYPVLRFEITNCRTLCMGCHYYITFKRKLPKGVVWGHNFKRRIA